METSGPPPFILSLINSHTHIKKSSKQLHFCAAIDILSSATENLALIRHSQQKIKKKNSALPPVQNNGEISWLVPKKGSFVLFQNF
jgi:hypothetical protein